MTREVFVSDEQSIVPIDLARWSALASAVLDDEQVPENTEVAISFVDEERITVLNERYLSHVGATDVLSFPIEDDVAMPAPAPTNAVAPMMLGDVVICPSVAVNNAIEHEVTLDDEIALLVVHGILHLLGRDHEDDTEADAMEARERQLLAAHHKGAS